MLSWLEQGASNRISRFRGMVLKGYLSLHGCKVGSGLKCKKWPLFRCVPKGNFIIGNNVSIGYGITFDIFGGKLTLGDKVNLTQNIIISAEQEVTIGEHTLIAENVSIRDSDHKTARDELISVQSMSTQAVNIGADVWIAAGCRVLRGAQLPDGCIIGANSVVLGSANIKPYEIFAGSPAKFIRTRE